MSFLEDRLFHGGQYAQQSWNKKLCFEARDTLLSCVDAQPNGNKYRCPDELYAYQMWCPTEVHRATSMKRVKEATDANIFTQEMLNKLSLQKQSLQ